MYKKRSGQTYYTNRHSCFLLQYHIVLVTKYRRPVLTGPVKDLVYRVIQDIFDEKKLVILEMNGEADHIHILFEADPFTAPGTLVNIIKTKTSRYARKEYGETLLKEYYWKPLFWSDSYFVTTVSENSLQMVQGDMDFKLTYKEDKGAVYWLESTPDTLGKFPFPFRLLVGYLLEENKITVKWRVENLGAMDMYFQIGAHPAFYFPEFDAATKDRGFFVFDRKSDLEYIMPTEKGCVSPERHVLKLNKEGLMPIDIHTFDCDTYIFDNKQLKKITLLDKKKKPHISLEFNSPLVALWSPTKTHPDCPFVCIEPWYGRCDSVGYSGELKDREWIQKLEPKETFDVEYKIIIE